MLILIEKVRYNTMFQIPTKIVELVPKFKKLDIYAS